MAIESGDLRVSGKKRLAKELEMIKNDRTLGISVDLAKDASNTERLNEWDIYIEGPPGTVYHNYILHAKMHFPPTYPFMPPTFRFITPMFHPNIYNDGLICISILHTERDDPTDTEGNNDTWTPGQNVRTVCLSIISLINEPNIFSPANVDASKMFRDNPKQYYETVKSLLDASKTPLKRQ